MMMVALLDRRDWQSVLSLLVLDSVGRGFISIRSMISIVFPSPISYN